MEGNVETEVGPLRPNELLSLVRKGDVQPDTMLRKDDSAWFAARTVGGLFEAALRQEVQYFCPGCNNRIKRPPVTCGRCLRDIGKGEAREVKPERIRANVDTEKTNEAAEEARNSVNSWLKKKVGNRQKK
jgi:hypothetical protein